MGIPGDILINIVGEFAADAFKQQAASVWAQKVFTWTARSAVATVLREQEFAGFDRAIVNQVATLAQKAFADRKTRDGFWEKVVAYGYNPENVADEIARRVEVPFSIPEREQAENVRNLLAGALAQASVRVAPLLQLRVEEFKTLSDLNEGIQPALREGFADMGAQLQSIKDSLNAWLRDDGPQLDTIAALVTKAEKDAAILVDLPHMQVPLNDLYQALPLLREVKREDLPHEPKGDSQHRGTPGLGSVDILRWEEQVAQFTGTYERHEVDELFSGFRRIIRDAESDAPHFLVLGPPGSGKSTLLKYLAQRAASAQLFGEGVRRIPVRVRLREWEAWSRQSNHADGSLAAFLAQHQYANLTPSPIIAQLKTLFQRGEVLLLLDGLDEIEGDGLFVSEKLSPALMELRNCPTVVTCRTVSYDRHRVLCSHFPVFTLAGLDDKQRDAFINAYPWQHPEQCPAHCLITELNRLAAMDSLATNPLLLSLICYMVDDDRGVNLPATRGELYSRTVDRLLERRRVSVKWPAALPPLPTARKRDILERACLTLFARMDHQQRLTFDESSLLSALECATKACGLVEGAPELANVLLSDLTCNSGLLRGDHEHGYFAIHLTVQEFLAGACLAAAANRCGNASNAEITFDEGAVRIDEMVSARAWDPRWEQVICFFAGQLDDPAPLLKMLGTPGPTSANPQGDDLFRHRLFLAAQCVADIPFLKRDSIKKLVHTITQEAFALWFGCFIHHGEGEKYLTLGNPHDYLLSGLRALTAANAPYHALPEPLVDMLHDRTNHNRHRAVWTLRAMRFGSAEVLGALRQTLQSDQDSGVRHLAVSALVSLGRDRRDIAHVLADCVQKDRDSSVRVDAILGLEKVGWEDDKVVSSLMTALRDTDSWVARGLAGGILGILAISRGEVVGLLLERLQEEANDSVRSDIVVGLGRSGKASDEILPALCDRLLHDPDDYVRLCAAGALGALSRRTDAVKNALVECLGQRDSIHYPTRAEAAAVLESYGEDKEHFRQFVGQPRWIFPPRGEAAAALGVLGCDDDCVLDSIMQQLCKDPSYNTESKMVNGLALLVRSSPKARTRLLNQLSDPSDKMRRISAEVLGLAADAGWCWTRNVFEMFEVAGGATRRGKGAILLEQAEVEALCRHVCGDKDEIVRRYAALALGQSRGHGDAVGDALIGQLARELNDYTRKGIIEALAKSDVPHEKVETALLEQLCSDKDQWVQREAAKALAVVAQPREYLRRTLTGLLKDKKNSPIHGNIARVLAKLFPAEDAVREDLRNWMCISEENDEIRWFAEEQPQLASILAATILDEKPQVVERWRTQTLAALGLSGQRIERLVIERLKGEHNYDECRYVEALRLRSDSLIDVLVDLAEKPAAIVQSEAFRALARIDRTTPRETEMLVRQADSEADAARTLAELQNCGIRVFRHNSAYVSLHVRELPSRLSG